MEEEEEQDLKEATRVDDETMDNITILVCNRLSASCASLDSFALSRYSMLLGFVYVCLSLLDCAWCRSVSACGLLVLLGVARLRLLSLSFI